MLILCYYKNMSIMSEFQQKLDYLLLEREIVGGVLSQEHESERVADLDQLWWQLTEEEQVLVEAEVGRTPSAPRSLNLTDRIVFVGCTLCPRYYTSGID